MKNKDVAVSLTSFLGGIISPLYKIKYKFVFINKLIYGQIVKFLTFNHPRMLLAVRPITLIGAEKIKLGEKVQIGQYSTLSTWPHDGYSSDVKLEIEDNVTIGAFAHITAINKVVIEEGVLMGKYVTITDNSHGYISNKELNILPIERELFSKGPVRICKNAWIGDKVTVLPGVCVGEGAIIGANSVVTKDIPPFTVSCGIPARVIKTLK